MNRDLVFHGNLPFFNYSSRRSPNLASFGKDDGTPKMSSLDMPWCRLAMNSMFLGSFWRASFYFKLRPKRLAVRPERVERPGKVWPIAFKSPNGPTLQYHTKN